MGFRSFDCTLAETTDQRDKVYRLRHECYLRKGSIAPRSDGRFSDEYDELPNSFSFLANDVEHGPVATVRITVVRPDIGWKKSPGGTVFEDHPAFHMMAGESFVEASRLCFGRQARRDAFVRLLGYKAAVAEYWGVEWLVACPRLEHTDVYCRMFGFRPMAEPRQYFGVDFKTPLLGIRRRELQVWVKHELRMRHAWTAARAQLRFRREIWPVVELPIPA